MNPMAVGADTWGLDVVPPIAGDRVFYAHLTFLKENRIYILETMNTGRLAKEGGLPTISGLMFGTSGPDVSLTQADHMLDQDRANR